MLFTWTGFRSVYGGKGKEGTISIISSTGFRSCNYLNVKPGTNRISPERTTGSPIWMAVFIRAKVTVANNCRYHRLLQSKIAGRKCYRILLCICIRWFCSMKPDICCISLIDVSDEYRVRSPTRENVCMIRLSYLDK